MSGDAAETTSMRYRPFAPQPAVGSSTVAPMLGVKTETPTESVYPATWDEARVVTEPSACPERLRKSVPRSAQGAASLVASTATLCGRASPGGTFLNGVHVLLCRA